MILLAFNTQRVLMPFIFIITSPVLDLLVLHFQMEILMQVDGIILHLTEPLETLMFF